MGGKNKSEPGCLRANALTLATMTGVVAGVVMGIVLHGQADIEGWEGWTQRQAMYVKFVGDLFLRMLKCVIIPLIIPSLVASVGSLDLR